jgi:pyruvate,water dikinase
VLETLKRYLHGQGANPFKRQKKQQEKRDSAERDIVNRLKGFRLKWFTKLLGWAQKYVPMREDNLVDIGLGYPLLRRMLHELGDRLAKTDLLNDAEDVFWLYESELIDAAVSLDSGSDISDHMQHISEEIQKRKLQWQTAKRVTPPSGLPERSGLMKLMERFIPANVSQEGDVIKGVGASPGQITVPASVLHGPEDFDRMAPGTALVAAITTPAWTPLFAIASAVVTDIGGPLSHGSIVAREYGIPAVLGTGVATKRIQSGQLITVDGDAGTVKLLA